MTKHLTLPSLFLAVVASAVALLPRGASAQSEPPEPIRALLLTGGGWHDYVTQKDLLAEGISARANVDWTIVLEGVEGSTEERGRHRIARLEQPDWAAGFDVVVYNVCFSGITDAAYIENIAKAHRAGVGAVALHCTMHTFRDAEIDTWRDLLGVRTVRHEAKRPFAVENLAPDHPIMLRAGESWDTPQGELYVIEETGPRVTPLARSFGVDTQAYHLTAWTNTYGKGRVFGTTIGHHNETIATEEYLDLVTRGLLWTAQKLTADGSPAPGFASAAEAKRLVLVAGRPSHARGAHEHNAGVQLFAQALASVPGLEVVTVRNGWPNDPSVLETADGILFFMDGGGRHPAIQEDRLALLQRLMNRGVGLALFHYATEVPADRGGPEFLEWVGGYYETGFSVNPIWTPEFSNLPNHPITRGVEPFSVRDEWYFNIRLREDGAGITPILQATPPDETRDGPYVNPKGPYEHIVAGKGRVETVAWAFERPNGGRGFGFTGGHTHVNWGDDNLRKLALNALVWITGLEVPPDGIESSVSAADLENHLD